VFPKRPRGCDNFVDPTGVVERLCGWEIHDEIDVEAKDGSRSPVKPDRDSADATEHSKRMDSFRDKMNCDGSKNGNARKAADAKDSSRPCRKKARRACFACQRAHLACGMRFLS
jgi:hypothetical protein